MPPASLAVAADLVMAAAFLHVGQVTRGRVRSGPAAVAFGVWWHACAAMLLASSAATALALAGVVDLAVHVALAHVALALLAVALGALLYHVAVIYFGPRRYAAPIGGFAFAVFAAGDYAMTAAAPRGVSFVGGRAALVFAEPWLPVGQGLGLALLAVLFAALSAYVGIALRVGERGPRRRATSLAALLACWTVFGILGATDLARAEWWGDAVVLVSLVVVSALVLAYDPDAWPFRRRTSGPTGPASA